LYPAYNAGLITLNPFGILKGTFAVVKKIDRLVYELTEEIGIVEGTT